MTSLDFKLYMITDRHQTAGRPLLEVIEAAVLSGISVIQFREKDLSPRKQFDLAVKVKKVTDHYGVSLMINDRVDLCLALDAAGVHLPSTGLSVGLVRALVGPDKRIAVSCHSILELKQAEALGADFAVFGPIYDTPSKRSYGAALGLPVLKQAVLEVQMPFFAIGGINQSRLADIFSAGADGVAMISEISTADDIQARCRSLVQASKML
ncbi:Thiazole tautomerase TenI [hydrothermal vent metagenome]|uniref:thiamine phosphate synthase n=1 Tax=hydrothermal vent metagenome TaxID=652676 RepID=A0A3B1CUS5_9ZZZZ